MSHLLAILGLGAACALWFALQRASGRTPRAGCERHGPSCDGCAQRDAGCPPPSSRPGLFG